jgi:hypothetical protein
LCSITNVTSHIFMNFCYVTSIYYKLENGQKLSKINDGLYWGEQGMFSTMVRCTSSLLQTWEQKIQTWKGSVELEVSNEMRIISGDIIAHTAFNTNYEMAKQVFSKVDNLVLTMSNTFSNPFFWIPGYKFTFLYLDSKYTHVLKTFTCLCTCLLTLT